MRFAVQHRAARSSLAFARASSRSTRDASRPDRLADQMKDGRDGGEQHQGKDGEARDIGFNDAKLSMRRGGVAGACEASCARGRARRNEAKIQGPPPLWPRAYGRTFASVRQFRARGPVEPPPESPPRNRGGGAPPRRVVRRPSPPPRRSKSFVKRLTKSLPQSRYRQRVRREAWASWRDAIARRRLTAWETDMPICGCPSLSRGSCHEQIFFASSTRFPASGRDRGCL